MKKSTISDSHHDFSLVLGGPLFQIFRRVKLSGDALELLCRRIVTLSCVAWLPLLLLSLISGTALGHHGTIPFLYDIEAHVRFLVALPLLIAAELVVHLRLRPIIAQFIERNLVPAEERQQFYHAIESTLRLRNSVMVELVLLVFVYILGPWVWRSQFALDVTSWYAISDGTQMNFTPAGIWLRYVSMPLFQFILLRWYLRFFLWFWFLFKISRLNLHLVPIHPDKAGGLGFLNESIRAFALVLVAQGVLLAGMMASQIFLGGKSLLDFKIQIIGFMGFFILAMLIPLSVFIPKLAQSKRRGWFEFGTLASRYTGEFQKKWVEKGGATNESVMGTADIQSLADLGNSYAFVREMRIVPFGLKDVAWIAAVTAIPIFPLLLTMFSLEELANHLIKAIF